MLRLKRIDAYVIRNFITLFLATFFICSFIVIMQTLWMRINDLVGKGLPAKVLLEFFYYTWLTLIPLALPLAILLASLMTFGDMGEKLELLAMKTAGVSLFRIMRSLIVFIALISIGAFFFSNDVIPIAQKKMYTLIYSIKQKSPEMDIPAGEFYSGIQNMRIYVRAKNHDTGAMSDVMLYDFSKGFKNASVTTADTMYVRMTKDKKNLILTLINGESFENMREQNDRRRTGDNVPYRRETFRTKEVLLDFDGDFNQLDESIMEDQHVSKNFGRLLHDVDSVTTVRDSLRTKLVGEMTASTYFKDKNAAATEMQSKGDTAATVNGNEERAEAEMRAEAEQELDADSLFRGMTRVRMLSVVRSAKARAASLRSDINYSRAVVNNAQDYYVRHAIELHRKFTLSFACLIFFFIGAPLGAIIRKGGLGMPVVASVIMFIFYYIIDTTGVKMARESFWPVWQGMWLSSAVLLPIGMFLTYKAANDSALFNADAYKLFFARVKERAQKMYRRMAQRRKRGESNRRK